MSIFESMQTTTVGSLLGGDTIRWCGKDWRVVNTPMIMHCCPNGNTLEVELYDGSVNSPIKVAALTTDKVTKVVINDDLLASMLKL